MPAKANPMDKTTVIGSQFEQPLLEFTGACAGCAETPYCKVVTQLFGDRMMIAKLTLLQRLGRQCTGLRLYQERSGPWPGLVDVPL